jgi:hypothetical protein
MCLSLDPNFILNGFFVVMLLNEKKLKALQRPVFSSLKLKSTKGSRFCYNWLLLNENI